jgi:UDP-N-acetylmuramyl pentapeptide phosphotransferase/UDP-N-acetylglucosamine-1-phosphate transferase
MFLLIVFLGILANNLGSALALMKKNVYPSQIFIGDTFCYFAGIILALSAVISIFQNNIKVKMRLISIGF